MLPASTAQTTARISTVSERMRVSILRYPLVGLGVFVVLQEPQTIETEGI